MFLVKFINFFRISIFMQVVKCMHTATKVIIFFLKNKNFQEPLRSETSFENFINKFNLIYLDYLFYICDNIE